MNVLTTLYYKLNSGKNIKAIYYLKSYLWVLQPAWLLRLWRKYELNGIANRADWSQIEERVQYYCRLLALDDAQRAQFAENSVAIHSQKRTKQKVYYLDSYGYAKAFNGNLHWNLLEGDIVHVPQWASVVKSRPLTDDNARSVLMKMDRVRHFIFVHDKKQFVQKRNVAIFRGKIGQVGRNDLKENRLRFMQKFFGNPVVDCGAIDNVNPEWHCPKMTISEHLDYKFILALEGNDVASNLKWVMSSNSLAVMPRPTCETWFMEGRLVANYHYVEIKPDFSDLEEKMQYYINHPDEAQQIIEHAHEWVAQFRNKKRERLISLAVMQRYLQAVNGVDKVV